MSILAITRTPDCPLGVLMSYGKRYALLLTCWSYLQNQLLEDILAL